MNERGGASGEERSDARRDLVLQRGEATSRTLLIALLNASQSSLRSSCPSLLPSLTSSDLALKHLDVKCFVEPGGRGLLSVPPFGRTPHTMRERWGSGEEEEGE